MRWEFSAQTVVVEVDMEMGEDRTLRLQSFDPFKRLLDAKMTRMRNAAQRIHDPHVEALERRNRIV